MSQDAARAYRVPINRQTWALFVRMLRHLVSSEVGATAVALFATLVALLLCVNGLNVVNSYVGRDFMTAIAQRDRQGFVWYAAAYVVVFGASTVVDVVYGFTMGRLGLLWRVWLTRRFVTRYLQNRAYYELASNPEVSNPDQRIAEDVRSLTGTTLTFVFLMLNASFTIVAFSGVLWSISPPLFGVAVAYAAGGSLLTVVLGRPLVWLNYNQSDKEAVFRADLLHVRENAEWVALSHREEVLRGRLLRHLGELADNFRRIIAVSRNLGFFTTGYNYLIQIIPALIVAPLFIRGQVEFGVITQAAIGFTQLLGAFSIVVNQFQSISSYAAVLTRLAALAEAIEEVESPTPRPAVEVVEDDTRVAYERLTLRSTENGQPLVRDLSVAVLRGTNCLIVGPDEAAKTALFRATAGVRDSGEGRIVRPPLDQIFFLPERPYLPPGTLRELLWGGGRGPDGSDEAALPVWRTVRLDEVAARVGGLDVEHDWDEVLSLGEQHFLAVARSLIVAPRFVFLDRISNVLGPEQIDEILNRLAAASITYLVIGTAEDRPDRYEAVLELARDGTWRWQPRRVARAVGESLHSDR